MSRSMVSKVERAEAQPTAVLLGRLSGALGMTLTELVARAEGDDRRLAQRTDQPVWVDPATGYRRRAVSPPPLGAATGLVEVELPSGARAALPGGQLPLPRAPDLGCGGRLGFMEGGTEHILRAGDCLQLGAPADCEYVNPGDQPCRYLVVVTRSES